MTHTWGDVIRVAFAGWLTMTLASYFLADHGLDATWDEKVIVSGVMAAGVELAIGLLVFLWVWALA